MLQMIPDINPWAFRTFTPEECPPEVLRSLKFGEQLSLKWMSAPGSYIHSYINCKVDNTITKQVMDKAIETNKWMFYPELKFSEVNVALAETVGNSSVTGFIFKTRVDKRLVDFTDSEESLEYWQREYPKIVSDQAILTLVQNNYMRIDSRFATEIISVPTVYYSKSENLIYNKVYKLGAGEQCVIPIFTSRHNGALIVRAREECIVPLGSGRIRTDAEAYEMSNRYEFESIRRDHLQGVTARYREIGCYEFADKSALMNVLAQLPVDIVFSLGTVKK